MKKWFCLGGIVLVLLMIFLLKSCHKEYRVLVTGDDNISNRLSDMIPPHKLPHETC